MFMWSLGSLYMPLHVTSSLGPEAVHFPRAPAVLAALPGESHDFKRVCHGPEGSLRRGRLQTLGGSCFEQRNRGGDAGFG